MDNEKSHPEVIPGNKELRRKLFFFTHTIRTFTKRQHGPIRVAPACVDTAQTDRAHEAVHGLTPGKKSKSEAEYAVCTKSTWDTKHVNGFITELCTSLNYVVGYSIAPKNYTLAIYFWCGIAQC